MTQRSIAKACGCRESEKQQASPESPKSHDNDLQNTQQKIYFPLREQFGSLYHTFGSSF